MLDSAAMSGITTHVLDTSRGRPASGVPVVLSRIDAGSADVIGRGQTDEDGRVRNLLDSGALVPGTYQLTFHTRRYFELHGLPVFYPHVSIAFEVAAGEPHYHVPLLLSPFGYSTYRGS